MGCQDTWPVASPVLFPVSSRLSQQTTLKETLKEANGAIEEASAPLSWFDGFQRLLLSTNIRY